MNKNLKEQILIDVLMNYENYAIYKASSITNDECGARESFEDGVFYGYINFDGTGDFKGYLIQCGQWYVQNFITAYYSKKRTEFRTNCCHITDEIIEVVGKMDKDIEDSTFDEYYNQFKAVLSDNERSLLEYLFEDEYRLADWANKKGVSKPYATKVRKNIQKKFIEFNS